MRVLLDTHLVLWALGHPAKLSAALRKRIEAADAYVSAVSIWEIGIKAALGKLEADPDDVLAVLSEAGFGLLPVEGVHAAAAAKLPPIHKDPFDRMLIAQARIEPMILLTNDGVLKAYGDLIEVF